MATKHKNPKITKTTKLKAQNRTKHDKTQYKTKHKTIK